MLLRLFQRCGHRPIVLMGGGTTKIGDPSGKDEQRQLLSEEQIRRNMKGIRGIFENFLRFGRGRTGALMIDNAEWLDRLGYIEFLREVGRHFTINRMLTFDSVRLRLEREQPLTFLEFNYMLLQAYDFVELARRYDCTLQMGGSDQWGNIVNGVELGRRLDQRVLYGLTTPLITTGSGAKMGKTASGAVWLNAEKRSPYDYWQFWRNVEDADVGRFLKLFTELPVDEIGRLESLVGAELNEAKKILATEATALAHGREAAEAAAETARRTFEEQGAGGELPVLTIDGTSLGTTAAYQPFVRIGIAASGGEAKRIIQSGGAKIGTASLRDPFQTIEALASPASAFEEDEATYSVRISLGKKKHGILRVRKNR
jgi:tyrosyl-tRNA synthetase